MAQLEHIVTAALQEGHHDESEVLENLRKLNGVLGPELSDDDLQLIARRLGERLNIDVDRGTVITAPDFEPWLAERKRDMSWDRWLAYRQLLISQGRSLKVIDKLDELTDDVLDFVGDPTATGAWARRGLVLGDVQSGKTGTYLGLFNKAADAGYRLVILLAGNTEVLRQQTQARVDEAFIGRDSARQTARKGTDVTPNRLIGVGKIRRDLAQASGMTTVLRDFRKSSYEASNITIQTDASHPYVFVLKKNKSILNAVIQWLEAQSASSGGAIQIPVLVLDDESDYASINTKEETDPTAINKAIRDILNLFTRSSYVAFTATPFANIFIDHGVENDLFPRDFVYSLEAPSNYVGSAKTFGTTDRVKTHGLHELDDVEPVISIRHRSHANVTELPSSLLEAVRTYFLSNAIRDLRDQVDKPRAMLVNVSRYKHVQAQVAELLDSEVSSLRNAIQLHAATAGTTNSDIARLKQTFEAEYSAVEYSWDEVLETLPSSTSDVRVMLFNSDKDQRLAQEDELAWDRPARMIAVGGDVLSRGLTLEGLCVSFFYRSVTASDTLMQMARWYGYRDGYEDLTRLWINSQSADNYRFAAESVEDLRTDLKLMLRQQLTPADFGLAVRKHPGALLITARNKMKSAQSASRIIGLAGRRLETTSLDLGSMAQNEKLLREFMGTVPDSSAFEETQREWPRWRQIDRCHVADFLENFQAPDSDPFFSGSTLSGWVRRSKAKQFATWDVVLARGLTGRARPLDLGGKTFAMPTRTLVVADGLAKVSGSSRRLAGATDLAGVTDPAIERELTLQYKAENQGKTAPERLFYPVLERPVLMLYPLDGRAKLEGKGSALNADLVLAVKVAIPGDPTDVNNHDGEIEYVINTVAQEQWLTEFTGSDDEDVDD